MNRILLRIVGLTFGVLSFSAQSYELATHARLTEQAYLQSNLKLDNALLENIGLSYSRKKK